MDPGGSPRDSSRSASVVFPTGAKNEGPAVVCGALLFVCPRGEAEARKSRDSIRQLYGWQVQSASPLPYPAIQEVLSAPRMSTYLAATGCDPHRALSLYGWNAQVSAALMLPAHFAEISIRNAVDEVLASLYGPRWPWDATFERSLPSPGGPAFNPRRHLQQTRLHHATTGKVIADLKFVFWPSMFTARHHVRLWAPHLHAHFPGLPKSQGAANGRDRIWNDLQAIRALRNRLAHHEPIISRNIGADFTRILDLIELRSPDTAAWVRKLETVSSLQRNRP